MTIVYIITLVILFLLIILIKKTQKKLEITKTIAIMLTLILGYNTLCAYILNLINIPITLTTLSLINAIFSVVILIQIIKNKQIQKYTMSKTNVLVAILFIVITAVIVHINFEDITKIRYVSMDAREHYKAAREFSENTSLSNKAKENNTVCETFMPMGYVNAGILFKILEPYIGTVMLYKIFILFEVFVYLLTGIMFYLLIEKYISKTSSKIIAVVFSIIYVLGYPLNAWISGFHYLVIGILFTETIIYMVSQIGKLELKYELIIMFVLNFGLILSYSLFCPFVYGAEFIYYIYKFKKEKMKLFLYILVTLMLTGVIGLEYVIIPSYGNVGNAIALEGWLYKNLWSNFILFVPFAIYAIYKSIRNKELTFENLMLVFLTIYMIILFIGTKTGKCSEYYFYKNYFIFWMMIILLNTKGMIKALQQKNGQYVVFTYTAIYLIIFSVSVYTGKTYVLQKADDSLSKTMEIFTFNNTMINVKNAEFITKDELTMYHEMEKVIQNNWKEYDNQILFVTDPTQERWIQSITGYKNILFDDNQYAIQNLQEENYKYIVTFENRNTYQNMKKYIKTEDYEIIYKSNNGNIYKKID